MKAAELRKSILQAAVQGKLVPQNPNDEPASKLLKRIQQEKDRLVRDGKIKKYKSLPPISEDEIPYNLPDGWVWCRLGELAQLIRGITFPTSAKGYEGVEGFVRCATTGSVQEQYNPMSDVFVPNIYVKNSDQWLQERDIMMSSANSRELVGKSCFWTATEHMTFGGFLTVIRAIPSMNAEYLCCGLQFLQKSGVFASYSTQTTNIANLNNTLINTTPFALPPLAEQQRIVSKINELMMLCDKLDVYEKELDTLETHFAEYLPKSILQAAVQGKLVPQNPNDEPATELLRRIQQEKARLVRDGKIKKEKPLPPISEDEIPYDLPYGWAWCRLGDICVINPRNQIDGNLDVSFTPMTLISSEYFGGHEQEIRKWEDVKSRFTHYAESDIVIAKITPCFQNGKSCIMKNLRNGYVAGTTELHVLRSILALPNYILIFAKSSAFLMLGQKNMTGTAGQQRVPTEFIKNCIFPLPPLEEQQCIISKVNETMVICEELRKAHTAPFPFAVPNIIPFPKNPKQDIYNETDEYKIGIAARGNAADGLSAQAASDAAKLFEDDGDE